jgi:hypothetical protein
MIWYPIINYRALLVSPRILLDVDYPELFVLSHHGEALWGQMEQLVCVCRILSYSPVRGLEFQGHQEFIVQVHEMGERGITRLPHIALEASIWPGLHF